MPTMRAIEIANGALRATQLEIPAPKPGEVLIKVAYAGVNRADLLQVAGKYPPPEGASPLPGMEVSGTIAALGDGVREWHIGDSVCALLGGGGYAEYVVAPAAHLLPLPSGIGLKEAAALPEATATAVMALILEARLQPGETVLIHGGTSGVGLIMGQLAKGLGAEVFATVGTEEKCAYLRQLGIHPINHVQTPFEQQLVEKGQGIDVIIDTLGAAKFSAHLQLLKPGGRMIMLAMLEGGRLSSEGSKLGPILTKHLHIQGTTLRSRSAQEKASILRQVKQVVWPMIEDKTMRPAIDSIFPLEAAEKAHARMQERLHIGKILLELPAS